MGYGLDLTHKEPQLTNVIYPKVFIRKGWTLTSETSKIPKGRAVFLHEFTKFGPRQTEAQMFDVRRLTNGEFVAKDEEGQERVRFSVENGEVQNAFKGNKPLEGK